ncbi:hypothetical protein ACVR1I_05880 [Streptococcus cameli]
MLPEVLMLFLAGLVLCLIAYFIKSIKWLRILLLVIGVFLLLCPFLLLFYLLTPLI